MNMFSEGRLKADSWNFEISINTTEDNFLTSDISTKIHELVKNGVYHSYYTDPFDVNTRKFIFKVFFENGNITSVMLSPAGKALSWANIEEKELIQDKKENDEWLMNKYSINTPTKFIWGTLDSVLDKKSGSSDIVLQFRSCSK